MHFSCHCYLCIAILISGNEEPHNLTSTVVITCSSDLVVQTIRWLDDEGQELFANVGQQQLNLTIDSVGLELDNTMYTCEVRATGITTNITEAILFRVNSKHVLVAEFCPLHIILSDALAPRIPESVEISSITPTSATVQFTLTDPFDVTRPEGFVVMYGLISGQLNSNSSVTTAISSSQTYSIPLTSLQIGTQYFYRVIATNQFVSNSTREMSFMTKEARKCTHATKLYTRSHCYVIARCLLHQGFKQFTQIYFRIITCKKCQFIFSGCLHCGSKLATSCLT